CRSRAQTSRSAHAPNTRLHRSLRSGSLRVLQATVRRQVINRGKRLDRKAQAQPFMQQSLDSLGQGNAGVATGQRRLRRDRARELAGPRQELLLGEYLADGSLLERLPRTQLLAGPQEI